MPDVQIRGGERFWSANRDEMRTLIDEGLREHARQRVEVGNIKRMEVAVPVQPPALTFFASQTSFIGTPDEGYVWSLKLVAVNLATAGTLAVYKASSSGATNRPLASFQTPTANLPYVVTFGSDAAELKHGEGVYFVASTNITGIYMTGEQVTAEKAALIYD